MASRPRSMNAGGENPEFIVRDFTHGVHNFAAREAIHDEEFWWCENVMPLASGNLANVPSKSLALATSSTESGANPGYAMGFNIGGVPYAFAAFCAAGQSGSAYIVNLNTFVVTKIITGLLSLTNATFATQYGSLGILIIDPNGYWDYNVTTANTLTAWNNSLTSATNTFSTSSAGGVPIHQVASVTGTGGVFQAFYQVISVVINAAGTGYVVGDSLTLTDNNPVTPAQIIVTSLGAGGSITGISLPVGGSYPGPNSSTPVNTGPSGTVVSGGTGTGATFTVRMQATVIKIISPGNGYSSSDTVADKNAVPTTIDNWALNVSGVIGGRSIATYAGRVWIASGRTIYFTEVGTYNNFGGSGSFFTITDAYLFNFITVLFSANNYLYIFGPTSIDALSNVTVVSGITAFSRINIVQGVGTSSPPSVFGYYRGVCFYDPSGFYILTGASPEKISEKITNIVGQNFLAGFPNPVYGGVLNFNQELCACFAFTFSDNVVSQVGNKRTIVAIYFRRRWWFYSTGVGGNNGQPAVMISTINSSTNLPTLYQVGIVTPGTSWGVYQLLFSASPTATWVVKTKFWDAHAPFNIKQAINAAIGAVWLGPGASGVTVTVDTETGSSSAVALNFLGTPNGYQLVVDQVNQGGGQYLGLTYNGSGVQSSQVNILALRGKQEGNLLE